MQNPHTEPMTPYPSEHFGAEMRRVRKVHGWTQGDLAQRLLDIGFPVDRSTVSRIETGDHTVNIDEWLPIATVLGINPLQLLTTRTGEDKVRITRECEITGFALRAAIRGQAPITDLATYYGQAAEYDWDGRVRIDLQSEIRKGMALAGALPAKHARVLALWLDRFRDRVDAKRENGARP